MARNTLEAWIPEEFSSNVIMRVQQTSVAEQIATKIPMTSESKSVPRTAGMSVDLIPKGGAYGEDTSLNDQVLLSAFKFGKALRIAEEDIDDSLASVIDKKKTDWATSYARMLDNSVFATTAAANGTTVAFNSVYYMLANADATTGYAANANIVKTLTTVALAYNDVSNFISLYEGGDYFDEGNTVIVAHPSFKGQLRGIKDTQGHPIFIDGSVLGKVAPTLFGYPIKWSNGLRLSATSTAAPTGNLVMFMVNPDYLLLGVRSGPESFASDPGNGVSMLTDEAIIKMRARRAFALGHEGAAACLQIVP